MIKSFLLAPGPTPVPPEVLAAMALPVIHHRTPQFGAVLAEVQTGLRELFGTKEDVLILASSGTGAMESAVTNLLSAGDEAIVVNGGKFGERWTKICQAYGVRVHEITVPWGAAVTPEAVRAALNAHPNARALYLQASETSTCVQHPVETIAALTRERSTLLVVDGITAVGVVDLPMDRLGIDVLITGSQKALMLPPGLALLALSPRAWQAVERATLPRFYFDLKKERKGVAERSTAWTPAISLIQGLRVALELMRREGWANLYARQARLARATRAGVAAIGLELLAKDSPSAAATAALLPAGVDGAGLVRYLRDTMHVTFAGGQDQLKGKIVRIAHLGYVGTFDVITALAALEMALAHFGAPVELGRGVAAAEAILREGLPPR
ncbi:MAG TPA: alanine--glyoxylate aminotransferase family protein [Candidatus Limnocylindria bacterium]|nr:alanine--glyoxylate aminotransferase family protein [Candidatus Limnocylindria bacterium]